MVYYFYVFTIVNQVKGGRGNVSNPFFLNTTSPGSSFFVIKYFMLNLTKCLLAAEALAIIHW